MDCEMCSVACFFMIEYGMAEVCYTETCFPGKNEVAVCKL